ncbi:hypothetical protein BC829DRAFT_416920 [Chytridium lagenaria]|nr:hypothetical protein BC829DRAFT_416920 [Chytridium lagenaria]
MKLPTFPDFKSNGTATDLLNLHIPNTSRTNFPCILRLELLDENELEKVDDTPEFLPCENVLHEARIALDTGEKHHVSIGMGIFTQMGVRAMLEMQWHRSFKNSLITCFEWLKDNGGADLIDVVKGMKLLEIKGIVSFQDICSFGVNSGSDKWWKRHQVPGSVEYIMFPKNIGNYHWVLVILDVVHSRVLLGDSSPNDSVRQILLLEFCAFWVELQARLQLADKHPLEHMELISDYPQQFDSTSCGICVIEYSLYFIRKNTVLNAGNPIPPYCEWKATPENVRASRLKIARELLALPSNLQFQKSKYDSDSDCCILDNLRDSSKEISSDGDERSPRAIVDGGDSIIMPSNDCESKVADLGDP